MTDTKKTKKTGNRDGLRLKRPLDDPSSLKKKSTARGIMNDLDTIDDRAMGNGVTRRGEWAGSRPSSILHHECAQR